MAAEAAAAQNLPPLANRIPVKKQEDLDALLADRGGKRYYEELSRLDVDRDALKKTLDATFKSRLKAWLEICAHCGMCAESCLFYIANDRDPKQTP